MLLFWYNDIIPFYYLAYEIKICTSENNIYLSDNFHTLGHRSKYVRSEIGVGSKECFDFSVDIGTQWQIFDLVFSRDQNSWFNIASISKLPTRIGLSNNAWLKKKRYFFIKNVFVFVINKTCISVKFRNNRPVLLLGHIFLWPFIITYGSLICPFLVQVYKVVRVRVVVVVVDKCHLEDVLNKDLLFFLSNKWFSDKKL